MDKELVSCLRIYDVCEGIDVDSWGAQVGEGSREGENPQLSSPVHGLPLCLACTACPNIKVRKGGGVRKEK